MGSVQERPSYERVEIESFSDPGGPLSESAGLPAVRRRCYGLGRPKVQIMLFVIAQPVTLALWSWALHDVLPSVQEVFGSHAPILDLLLFYVVFSALVVVLFPLGVIDLAAGFLFGLWAGYPVALATKTSGSVLCFLLSRHTCSGYLRRTLFEHYDWLAALGLMMREKQFRTMALLRFSAIPAALKNYGCGSLGVSLSVYASVTAMALSVESLLLVPVGAKFDSLEGMMSRKQTFQEKAVLALGIFLLIALFFAIRRTVRLQIEKIQRDTGRVSSENVGVSLAGGRGDEFELRRQGGLADKTRVMEHAMF